MKFLPLMAILIQILSFTFTTQVYAQRDQSPLSSELMYDCVLKDDIHCTKKQLSQGASITYRPTESNRTMLMVAVANSSLDLIKLLLNHDSSDRHLNIKVADLNLFEIAAQRAKFEIFKYLINRTPKLTSTANSKYGASIFKHICVGFRTTAQKKFSFLIKKDVNFLNQKILDNTFKKCIRNRAFDNMKFLADKAELYNKPYTPSNDSGLLQIAAHTFRPLKAMQLMLELNSSPEFFWSKDDESMTAVEIALQAKTSNFLGGDLFLLSHLSQKEVINFSTRNGESLIHLVMRSANLDALQIILDINNDDPAIFTKRDHQGDLPVDFAGISRDEPTKRILFARAPKDAQELYLKDCFNSLNFNLSIPNLDQIKLFCDQLKSSMKPIKSHSIFNGDYL